MLLRRPLVALRLSLPLTRYIPRLPVITWFTLAVLYLGLVFGLNYTLSNPEWVKNWYPAARALWLGQDPYAVANFFNPPWLLVLLAPTGLLPAPLGCWLFLSLQFACFVSVFFRFSRSHRALFAFLMASPVIESFLLANIDGLVLAGLLLPPAWGLPLVLLKPQVGFGIAVYWTVDAWRQGGVRQVTRTLAPLLALLAVGTLLFPRWWQGATHMHVITWLFNPFPYLIPLGLYLIYRSLRGRNIELAAPVGLCVTPYASLTSWAAAFIPVLSREKWLIAASLLSWLPVAVGLYLSR